jgi:hypothetical protein
MGSIMQAFVSAPKRVIPTIAKEYLLAHEMICGPLIVGYKENLNGVQRGVKCYCGNPVRRVRLMKN